MPIKISHLVAWLAVGLLLRTPANAYDYEYEYDFWHVYSPNALDHVVEQTNIQRLVEGGTGSNADYGCSYWYPTVPEKEARLTFKFEFEQATSEIYLQSYMASFSNSGTGYGSLWGSVEGIDWVMLMDAPNPSPRAGAGYLYASLLPESLLGASEIWIQGRLQTNSGLISAQFLRWDTRYTNGQPPNNVFELRANFQPQTNISVLEGLQRQADAGHSTLSGNASVAKTGRGTVLLDAANTFSSSLSVKEGTVLASNPQALGTATLNVASGATFAIAPEMGSLNGLWIEKLGTIAGKLDVGVGRFTLGPSGGSVETVKSLLNGGRDSEGRWTGTSGITSTAAAADLQTGIVRSVGWIANPAGSVTVAYAAPGDTNLDGEVNVFDLVNVNGSGTYGRGNPSNWSQGDFDYNGVTNIFDMVQTNGAGVYGRGSYLPAAPTSVNAVPEPASWLLASTGLASGYYPVRRRGA